MNSLAREKSPYLLQHAGNPVDWLPWGEAAFARARAEQKPIFLSVGYSTCHWCHVMAHESFENPEIAALLNEHFVAVKVDREERPDVDRVYMTFVQTTTGHGGWPLSAWLTPELKPFYGGTYFPPEDRQGRAGFPRVLRAIARGWAEDRARLVAEGERVVAHLRENGPDGARQGSAGGADSPLAAAGGEAFEKCFNYFGEAFDAQDGGFGGAPKFPRAANLNFIFRASSLQGLQSEGGAEGVKMAARTLQKMAQGGIHDHVGGGFHRYSVDAEWFVPHFEKMLYDQAQIALNALDARLATGDERHAWLARDIFGYVARDLTSPAGGFYSAEDADSALPETEAAESATLETQGGSRHAEGAFYVWTMAEIEAALKADATRARAADAGGSAAATSGGHASSAIPDAALFCAHFGVTEDGNVPAASDPQGEFSGRNILRQRQPLAATAQSFHLTPGQANDQLLAALARLRAVRARRPRPQLDDKIVTAWNGLMISALARGHCVLELSESGEGVISEGRPEGGARPLGAPDRTPTADSAGAQNDPPASRFPCLSAAIHAAEFLERELYDPARGVLYRSFRAGRGASEGFAEDYAFLVQGLIDLYEASFELRWLQWAERLQQTMDALFWDESNGGYFNSAAGDPGIILRLKEDYDGAEPAPNSVAAANLLRLGAIFDGAKRTASATLSLSYRERGLLAIEAFRARWSGFPYAMPQMLCALELALEAPRHVVLAGDPGAGDFRALASVLHERLGPRRTLLAVTGDAADRQWLAARAPWLAEMRPLRGRATAYVCAEFTCQAPVTDPAGLRAALKGSSGH